MEFEDVEFKTSSAVRADATAPSPHPSPQPLTRKLDRYLKSIPVISFGITLASSWASVATGFQAGLYNGGPSSLVWGFLVAGPGTAMTVLSIAEIASITPSVGAQYRWAAIYCPSFLPRRFMSFVQGWLTVFAWMAGATLGPFFTGSQITGLLILNYPNTYHPKPWHTPLLGYAVILIPLVLNVFVRKTLKAIEIIGAILNFVFFVSFAVILICLGGRNSPGYVFTANSGGVSGWHDPTIQWCIGLLSAVFPLIGFDGLLHLSDEVKDPAIRVPKSMVISWVVNSVLAFCFTIIILFFMGDPGLALASTTNWPIIEICLQATHSNHATNAMMAMIMIPNIIALFNNLASVTRLTWAFARDDGLPFSNFFKIVHTTLRMPLRALGLTTIIAMLLLLIPIGSATAFNAILSLLVLAFEVSYTLPCIFVFLRRLTGEHVVTSAWSLGRWGLFVNGAASVWGIFISIWLCFPPELPVTAANMNWSGPIVGFVVVFAIVDWVFRGRYRFAVPTEKSEHVEDYITQ